MSKLDIVPLDVHDPAMLDSWIDCSIACDEANLPGLPPTSPIMLRARALHYSDHSWTERHVAVDGGRVVGLMAMRRDLVNNTDKVAVGLTVHPECRRHGIGSALYDVAEARARDEGVSAVWAGFPDEYRNSPDVAVPGRDFAAARGFVLGLKAVRFVNDLTQTDERRLDELYQEAASQSSEYDVVAFTRRVPDSLVSAFCRLKAAVLTDSPTGDLDVEGENYSTDEWRKLERETERMGELWLGVAALHRASGALAGFSELEVLPGNENMASQSDTIVDPAHRGRRLGLRLKIDLQRHLRSWRPQMRFISTFQAETNHHMIAINQKVGFQAHSSSMNMHKKLK